MALKPIITGSTGMIGKGLLLECLEDSNVEKVITLNRNLLELQHDKLKEILHKDLSDLSGLKKELAEYNICYFCTGVSAAGMSELEYMKITYDLTLNFAKALLAINPDITFCYISGAGTDSSEKGRMMWARVKGKTENDLLKLPFKKSYMLRPAFIQPKKGIRSRTRSYNIIYALFKPFYPLLKLLPKYVTSTDRLGQAMIKLGLIGSSKRVLENIDLNKLVD